MKLDIELDNLNKLLYKMTDEVQDNIRKSLDYYFGKEIKETYINDDLIDNYERLIEEICINILIKERLYGRDLKEVTGILKLVADVERIGDHAEDIYNFATILKKIQKDNKLYFIKEIDDLSKHVLDMLKKSILAYVNKDIALANEIIEADNYVDNKYMEILDLMAKEKNPDNFFLSFAIYNAIVVKYLERIADHSVNICEWTVYIVNGFHKDKKIC